MSENAGTGSSSQPCSIRANSPFSFGFLGPAEDLGCLSAFSWEIPVVQAAANVDQK
jgi:hypothetical protein